MTAKGSLTEGPIIKGLALFALPIFLGQVFQQLYNTADAFIVGKFLSDEEYAAVTSSGTLIFLLVGLFAGISVGAGVVIARYFGAKDEENLHAAVHTTVALGLIAGVLLTVIGIVFTPHMLRLMGTPESIIGYSIEYFRMYFVGSLAISMYNLLRGVLQAVGDSKSPLYFLMVSSLVNIGLDLLFIGVFGWGVWSAALATTISQFLSATLCLVRLMQARGAYRLQLGHVCLRRDKVSEIIRFGLPSGLQNSIIAIANVVVQSNINAFGDAAVGACGTYAKLESFVFLPIMSITMALTTFVSQNLGAKQHARIKKGAAFGIVCCVIMAELVGLLLALSPEPLIRLFTDNPASIEIAIRQSRIESLFFFLMAFSHCIAAVMRGAGRPTVPMFVMLVAWCVVRVTYISLVVPLVGDIWVVFSAYPITWGISAIVFAIFFFCTDWIHAYDRAEAKKSRAQIK